MIWKNERRRIDELKPAAYNPRKLSAKAKEDLNASIEQFDLVDPLVINSNGVIIGGHQRYNLLRDRGVVEVDVRVPERELNEIEERELNLRLNKNTGEFDLELLTMFDPAMLLEVGFDSNVVDEIKKLKVEQDNFNIEEEYEKIVEPVSKTGDLFVFGGGHRLLCGDSTKIEDVNKLMDGKKAAMVFCDPPYNVNYDYWGYRATRVEGVISKQIFSDKKTPQDYQDFIKNVFTNAYLSSMNESTVYCWFASKCDCLVRGGLIQAGWHVSQTLIWLKDRITLSPGQDYHRIYEPCMYGWKKENKHKINKAGTGTFSELLMTDKMGFEDLLEVIYSKRDNASTYIHPTQKPLRIIEKPLRKSSDQGDIILDLFGGSGSTMMAAHQMKRCAYLMEMDQKFVDCIVQRYEKLTGEKATKI